MRSRDRGHPEPPSGAGGANPPNGVCPLRLRGPRSRRRSTHRAGAAGRRPGPPPPRDPDPGPGPPPTRPAPAALPRASRRCPDRPPPGRYRPRLPRLCLGVSPPASWQRSLRHWKSNRNPAASLLLRSLAIARSLPRTTLRAAGCAPLLVGGGKVRGGRRRAALAGAESPCPRTGSHLAGTSHRG